MSRFQHELKRQLRFESGLVSTVNAKEQADISSGTRGYPRTQVSNTMPESVWPGMQTVNLTGGDEDYPTTIGISPWLT